MRHASVVWRALAGVTRLVGHAAPAWVHRRDQLKPRRIDDAMIGARDRHFAGLDRLAQAVQHLGLKLRQFVEEQDAVVGERNLAGLGVRRRLRPAPASRPNDGGFGTGAGRSGRRRRARPRPNGSSTLRAVRAGSKAAGSTANAGRASTCRLPARRSSKGCGRRPPRPRARVWRSPGP